MVKNLLKMLSIRVGDEVRGRNDFLKTLAIVSMTIDHIGAIFFPDTTILRIIGRLALPIFSASLADGFIYTSNFRKYFVRMFIVGLIAQIPYALLFDMFRMNILLTFSVSLLVLWAIIEKNLLVFSVCVLSFYYINFEYGLYCPIMICLYYVKKESKLALLLLQSLNVAIRTYFVGPLYTIYQIVGVALPIFFRDEWQRISINKYFFYYFYPGHLLLLLLIKYQLAP